MEWPVQRLCYYESNAGFTYARRSPEDHRRDGSLLDGGPENAPFTGKMLLPGQCIKCCRAQALRKWWKIHPIKVGCSGFLGSFVHIWKDISQFYRAIRVIEVDDQHISVRTSYANEGVCELLLVTEYSPACPFIPKLLCAKTAL